MHRVCDSAVTISCKNVSRQHKVERNSQFSLLHSGVKQFLKVALDL